MVGYLLTGVEPERPKNTSRIIPALGTMVEIQIRSGIDSVNAVAYDAAFKEVERIDSLFTDFDTTGAIGKINQSLPGKVVTAPEVVGLIKRALEISSLTEGKFDITLGRVVRLWGFKDETMHIPAEDSVKEAVSTVGWRHIKILDDSTLAIDSKLALDLSGIAKGYAVDRAFAVLDSLGVEQFLINAGGEIRCKGEDWTTGIQDPRNEGGVVQVILPKDKAVATSGDYENFFQVAGKRYCHLFDPTTGFPAETVISVTVLADDAASADAIATALFVEGSKKSKKIIEKFPGCEYFIIDKTGEKHYSPGFKKYIRS